MRLRTLRIVNYRRYRDAALEFPDGLIGIVGRNGAGKSTLLEAILWGLFGHDAARTSKELIKRQGAAPGEDVQVRLEFDLDGQPYTVLRRLKGKSMQPEAAVESGGQLLVSPGANSWDQANQAIAKILGFDRTSFESTVVAKQGELAALSELRPAARKRLLLEMLGVERVETAIQSCRSESRLLEAKVFEARRALEAEPRLVQRAQEAGAELAGARSKLDQTVAALAEARSKATDARQHAERLLEARGRDQELRLRLGGLQGRLETIWTQRTRLAAEAQILREREAEATRLSTQLADFDEIDSAWDRLQATRQKVEERRRLEERLARLAKDAERWRAATDAHATNGSSPAHLESDLRAFMDQAQAAQADLAQFESERARITVQLEHLDAPPAFGLDRLKARDDCPVCERPLGDALVHLQRRHHEQAAHREQARATYAAGLVALASKQKQAAERQSKALAQQEEIRRRLQAVLQRIRDAETAKAELARVEQEAATLRDQLGAETLPYDETQERRLLAQRKQRDEIRERLARAQEAAKRLPRVRDEDRVLQSEEQKIVDEREKASRELHHLAYPAGAWEEARAAADTLQRRLDALERERVQWSERTDARQREVASISETMAELAAARRRIEGDVTHLRVLETIAGSRGDAGVLPEFKAHLVGRIRPALARAAGSLVGQMTGGRYGEIVLDEDYGVHLYDGAVAHPIERFSGGERDVTNLCLRLAVSELVANARGRARLEFVALDEVFGSQDAERREAVVRSLGGLSQVFRQVFVVTHLEDVRDRLDHVLRIEDEGDGTSRLEASWQGKT